MFSRRLLVLSLLVLGIAKRNKIEKIKLTPGPDGDQNPTPSAARRRRQTTAVASEAVPDVQQAPAANGDQNPTPGQTTAVASEAVPDVQQAPAANGDHAVEWAPRSALERGLLSLAEGKMVGLRSFRFKVVKLLGAGKSGEAFLVDILQPVGIGQAVLKVSIGVTAVSPLSNEAAIMTKAEEVPHSSRMLAHGDLWLPSEFWGSTTWPDHFQEALLMSLAPGKEVSKFVEKGSEDKLEPEDKAVIEKQMVEFGKAMDERNLLHADLAMFNVFYDKPNKKVTVIDFGNGQDFTKEPKNVPETGARMQLCGLAMDCKNGNHEVQKFLQNVGVCTKDRCKKENSK